MGEVEILVENVTKRFKQETVLDGISLEVEQGSICGIVGRNGSGKTVLFKCICGLMETDEGKICVDRKKIGAVIEKPGFLKQYSGYKNLQILSALSGKKIDINEVLKIVGLENARNKKVGKYSMGMKQRLGIAQALMEDQKILILDEPMNGLDNKGVENMRELFLQLKNQGKTFLIASHNREDIDLLCDVVYEMDAGKIRKVR